MRVPHPQCRNVRMIGRKVDETVATSSLEDLKSKDVRRGENHPVGPLVLTTKPLFNKVELRILEAMLRGIHWMHASGNRT